MNCIRCTIASNSNTLNRPHSPPYECKTFIASEVIHTFYGRKAVFKWSNHKTKSKVTVWHGFIHINWNGLILLKFYCAHTYVWHRPNCFPVSSLGRLLCVVPWWKLYADVSNTGVLLSLPFLLKSKSTVFLCHRSAIVWWAENEDWPHRLSKPMRNILPIDCPMTRYTDEPMKKIVVGKTSLWSA